jgi:lipopolysaccharide transport system ATP-binding protein
MTPVIRLTGVSKAYRRRSRQPTTLKTFLVRDLWRRPRSSPDLTWALRDVDLTVEPGATVVVIGRNGSGKSTLLQLIGGMLKPTAGTVRVNGRTSALIELGAGFHPELTGRENVIVNGVILGLSKSEIRRRFDEIVAFAGLQEFIDAPVRTYSTGMYMRLGFSVAVHVDPDILLIDEVLAVGDLPFVRKCLERMDQFKKEGKTIVVVTHSLETARSWADYAVWLHEGRVRLAGEPSMVAEMYRQEMAGAGAEGVEKGGTPEIVALAVTPTNDGAVAIPGATGTAVFTVATMNMGAAGTVTVTADTGRASLQLSLAICQTDPSTGVCIDSPAPQVTLTMRSNETPTFGVFVRGLGAIEPDPVLHRIFVRFIDESGITRGVTSVGVRTV